MSRMSKDLGLDQATEQKVEVIDLRASKEVPELSLAEEDNTLASLMGETIKEKTREEALEDIELFPLGHTVELQYPVTMPGGGLLKEVAFINPIQAKNMMALPQLQEMKLVHQIAIVGHVTGINSKTLGEILMPDMMKLIAVAMTFFIAGHLTGQK